MMHEKIIKDQRGTLTIRITLITFTYGGTDIHGNYYRYDVCVLHTAPKKRTAIINYNIATESEIHEAKMELWNLIKP